jgi:four helix bundle suffix protein
LESFLSFLSAPEEAGFIPPHGGYENLLSYQKALIVFDGTVFFVKKWLPAYGDRTVDQKVQAARSGKQNIAEGSIFSATSKETELKLTNTARASLEELKEDYEDFLRARRLREWPAEHRYSARPRELNRKPGAGYADFQKGIESADPEIAGNVLLGLTKVASYLLKRQIEALEQAFLNEGGIRERMVKARVKARNQQTRKDPKDKKTKRTAPANRLATDVLSVPSVLSVLRYSRIRGIVPGNIIVARLLRGCRWWLGQVRWPVALPASDERVPDLPRWHRAGRLGKHGNRCLLGPIGLIGAGIRRISLGIHRSYLRRVGIHAGHLWLLVEIPGSLDAITFVVRIHGFVLAYRGIDSSRRRRRIGWRVSTGRRLARHIGHGRCRLPVLRT